jgi:hypothetical protein
MDRYADPRTDPMLIGLKGVALQGEEQASFYKLGLLSVIEQIEKTGTYVPARLGLFIELGNRPDVAELMCLKDEIAEMRRELTVRGWSPKQGAQFAMGVCQAESSMEAYRFDPKKDEIQAPPDIRQVRMFWDSSTYQKRNGDIHVY